MTVLNELSVHFNTVKRPTIPQCASAARQFVIVPLAGTFPPVFLNQTPFLVNGAIPNPEAVNVYPFFIAEARALPWQSNLVLATAIGES